MISPNLFILFKSPGNICGSQIFHSAAQPEPGNPDDWLPQHFLNNAGEKSVVSNESDNQEGHCSNQTH